LRRAEVLIPIHIAANDLFSRQSRRAYPVDSPYMVKPSVHQPASPPVFGGADFYKFLTFIHTNIGYDHSPIPGCGLISLMVFMLKLRGELRTRTPYPKVQSVFKAVPARLSG